MICYQKRINIRKDHQILEIWLNLAGELHRAENPAKIIYHWCQGISSCLYCQNHRRTKFGSGIKIYEEWNQFGKMTRSDGPAITHYHLNGEIESQGWYQNGQLHREDGPAVITYEDFGSSDIPKIIRHCEWFLNGELQGSLDFLISRNQISV